MENNKYSGIVYVLTNPAMPGLVKIGKTVRDSVDARLSELYSCGVPVPFECAYAARVADETRVEKAFHLAFGPYRINPKREFFQIEPEQAIVLLQMMAVEDVTPQLRLQADAVDVESKEAVRKLKAKRPNLNFLEMEIPRGAILQFVHDESETVVVESERKVLFRGELSSLTAATRALLNGSYNVAPGSYWLYQGRLLRDIYDDTYGET